MYMIEYPWDGPTSWIFAVIIFLQALSVVSLRRPTAALLFLQFPLVESFRPSLGTGIITAASLIYLQPFEESF